MKTIYFDVSIPRILSTKLFAKIFPGVFYTPISPVQFRELDDPPLPGPNWVRVENIMSGICGTDLAMFFVNASPAISIAALPSVPRVFLGHELVGRIVERGGKATQFSIGDRVMLQRYLPCCSIFEINPPCEHCRAGNYTLCENFAVGHLPKNLGAGFGDQFVAHSSQLMKVPDQMSDDEAVMVEPAAVSLHAALRRRPQKNEKILVIGAGAIGLTLLQFLRALEPDCRIYLLEKIDFKKELGLKVGADEVLEGDPYDAVSKSTGANLYRGALKNNNLLGGFDAIYDCVGHDNTIHHGLRWLRARGDYVMIGNQLFPVKFDQTPIWNQELRVFGVNAHGRERHAGQEKSSFEMAVDMILDGRINLKGFITHRFPLEAYRNAFQVFSKKREKVIKIVLENSGT